MNVHNSFFSLLFVLLLLGCQDRQNTESAIDSGVAATEQAEPPVAKAAPEAGILDAPAPLLADRKIIRNATLRFRVEKLVESEPRLTKLSGQFGGMITNSEENRANGVSEIAMTVRIPSARLDAFIAALLKESIYTDTKTITADDVTRQYADTDARIRVKKATEVRYLQLLQKARNVQEVMAVEEQLGKMREDIEAQEAVLRALKNDVTLSTVSLTVYERVEQGDEPDAPFYVRAGQNFQNGFGFVGQFIVGAFYFVPLLLIAGAIWWAIRLWRKR